MKQKGETTAENKVFLIIPIIISLVFLPFAGFGQEEIGGSPPQPAEDQMNASIPPVEQALVPEGVFAVQLVQALEMGKVQDEVQAENVLSAVGIEPKNGWIADYPMTPDIVAEIETSVAGAAQARKITMGNEEAMRAVAGLEADLGLNIQPGGPPTATGEVQEASAPVEVVNNYYYDYGPPVVTYYPPPWDYDYLYAWVPFPFWCGGFFFSGFFVLHDFHRHIHFHDHDFVVTNHVVNRTTHTVSVVDPVSGHVGSSATVNRFASTQAFSSPKIQNSARTILSRSQSRIASGGVSAASGMGNGVPRTSPSRIQENQGTIGREQTERMANFRSSQGTGGRSFNPPAASQRSFPAAPPRVSEGKAFSPPAVSQRSFSSASPHAFSSPPVSQGHAFSAPASRGFSEGFHAGGSSFGGFHEGSSGGFHGGGGSLGGFHGGGGGHR